MAILLVLVTVFELPMTYLLEKYWCTTIVAQKPVVDSNVDVLLGSEVKAELLRHTSQTSATGGSSTFIFLSCSQSDGEIFSHSAVKTGGLDPNLTLVVDKSAQTKENIYTILGNGLHLNKLCVLNLVATEQRLNALVKEWRDLARNKVLTIKKKRGLIEALRWNDAYADLEPRYKAYTFSELLLL